MATNYASYEVLKELFGRKLRKLRKLKKKEQKSDLLLGRHGLKFGAGCLQDRVDLREEK